MNLYLISQSKNNDYDSFDSAIVCARSAKAAREIHPYNGTITDEWDSSSWVRTPKEVNVEYLGKAKKGLKQGVICASFNAG